jgi:flagellar motor switch protein FliM
MPDMDIAVTRLGLKFGLACGRRTTFRSHGATRMPAAALAGADAVCFPLESGLDQPGALIIDRIVALTMADLLLGGVGDADPRDPEPVELSLIRRHLNRTLVALTEPLAAFGVTSMQLGEVSERSPATVLGGSEVFALRIEITLPDTSDPHVPGGIILALPYRPLTGLADHVWAPTDRALAGVPMSVSVQFPPTVLSAYDVQLLEPGDVLRLDLTSPNVIGIVDGVPLLTAALGRCGRRKAIVVQSIRNASEGG